ncbi:hypothetical protein SD37_10655 [Amycolatopsis orientalis]|uniref:Enoyl-CoA hydratase n=1 Tax=Amycolatopsis orientalis TaxID=31958 RepID=A0A193BV06_AMYOR|nr:hypothetical protein [Amycolatopsis orientalis]ANN16056.1 hypothetical protein SD37_10655 [Amycolatopsis orientalis]
MNTLLVEKRDDGVVVTLNRPTARNAINAAVDGYALGNPEDDLAQAVLFESDDERGRMTRFLERNKP